MDALQSSYGFWVHLSEIDPVREGEREPQTVEGKRILENMVVEPNVGPESVGVAALRCGELGLLQLVAGGPMCGPNVFAISSDRPLGSDRQLLRLVGHCRNNYCATMKTTHLSRAATLCIASASALPGSAVTTTLALDNSGRK